MGRRTTNPVTRAEAQRVLAQPIRDVEVARLAASYLDLLDAFGPAVDAFMTPARGWDAPEDDPE